MYFDRTRGGWLLLWGMLVASLAFCSIDASAFGADPQPDAKALERVMEVQERNTGRLFALEGVEGTATGLTPGGEPAVIVFTTDANVRGIPRRLEGVPVIMQASGPFLALKGPPPDKGKKESVDTTSRFPRPVPTGVSTGNAMECSAGTFGCRLVDSDGEVYALSNNHVYAAQNFAPPGTPILQPGLYDTNCQMSEDDIIGVLSGYVEIRFDNVNRVDAAIAWSMTGAIGNATPPDGYGTPKSKVVSPYFGQKVQKYGRTTQNTRGDVTAVNAMVSVGYGSGTAMFVEQIIVQSRKPFIKAGDSGSVLVEDPQCNTVGLLFAGTTDGKLAVANRMDNVLMDLLAETGKMLIVDGE